MNLWLTNTLTRKKELFSAQNPPQVTMYVCGITPYDKPHLGHGRVYVAFDLLYRLLGLLNYKVIYARNFTDIDDKIIDRALREECEPHKIAERYIAIFHNNMTQLNCLSPTDEPRVTEYIHDIIIFIEKLVAKGKAYQVDNDIYFDINSFPDYGKLARRALDEQEAGARVAVSSKKKNSGDFALWKGNNEEKFWQSPWGYGRPGWHIECSVMAYKLLGESIDLHCGGMDLIFPHHENEVAQSEALFDKTFAHTWVHNAFININKEKMSKSLGNFITLDDAFKVVDPMIMRFYLLQHQYKKPVDFNEEDLNAAQTAYKRISQALAPYQNNRNFNLEEIKQSEIGSKLLEALCDDLNTPKFLGIFFEHLKEITSDPETNQIVSFLFKNVMGLHLDYQEKEKSIPAEIQILINQREEARKAKNWIQADALRDRIKELGYDLQDKKV